MTYNFEKYQRFIANVDKLTESLSSLHSKHMQCRKGCDLCCMNYRIFPVEYFAVQQALSEKPVKTMESKDGSCVFLKDHACQIYEHRPFICRTHGLPLLYMNEDQWELSACELNFTEFDDEDFSAENTFPQDRFNSELFQLNKQFIADNKLNFSEFDLLEMKDLHKG
ncbi:YkgJ family cysteine cluster protein [Mangrovibacterium diazotrophicum]|uniref:Putative zinc-or iron-chelating protein n=1 Tax=Mangrovibacterium diazotrophicum TaxID=1261403 RepID=A0A419VYE2_9BACT|nr:YkgJ family cysteine cluster protein [Mangrovibacterium diazotrophicum]RKD88226.1 putative zinc- or iron-chelating protein [Mangrovibacterium diazotrophicum]